MKDKQQLYIVLQNIRYHHPEHELGGQLVFPDSEAAKAGLPMDHLTDEGLALLLRKRILAPKPEGNEGKAKTAK